MSSFSALIDGKEQIVYNDKIVRRAFKIKEPGEYVIKLKVISENSPFNQAILVFFNSFNGEFFLLDKRIDIPKKRFPHMILWTDDICDDLMVKVKLNSGSFMLCNGSDPIGTKQICHSLYLGCAIHVEKLSDNLYRFNCNDHEDDDDFNDLIFDMEINQEIVL